MIRKIFYSNLIIVNCLFFSLEVLAESIDLSAIYAPDVIYDPGTDTSPMATNLRDNLGVQIPEQESEFPQVKRVIINTQPRGVQPPPVRPEVVRETRDEFVSSTTGITGANEGQSVSNPSNNPNNPAEDDGGGEKFQAAGIDSQATGNGAGAGGSSAGSFGGMANGGFGGGSGGSSAPGGQSPQVKGGLLYSGGDSASNNKAAQGKKSGAATARPAAFDPVALNQKNANSASKNTDNESDSGQAFQAASGGNVSSPAFRSGGSASPSSPSSGPVGVVKNILAEIAGGLGLDQFFGASGGSSNKGSRQGHSGSGGSMAGETIPRGEKLKDPRAILQAQFDKYRRRGLASSPEFGDMRGMLFTQMCKHYIDYARENRIPNDTAACPEN